MKKFLLGAAMALGLVSAAFAQSYVSGAIVVTSFAGHKFSMDISTTGPQSSIVLMSGGTFVCAGGTATVVDAYTNAGSIVWTTLKTVGGTVAQPFVATITPGTGFTITCGGSDTSTYNYLIFG